MKSLINGIRGFLRGTKNFVGGTLRNSRRNWNKSKSRGVTAPKGGSGVTPGMKRGFGAGLGLGIGASISSIFNSIMGTIKANGSWILIALALYFATKDN